MNTQEKVETRTPEEILRFEARAQAQAEFKEIERKARLAEMLEEERAKLRPPEPEQVPEDLVDVTIDVPPNVFINQNNETGVSIDGRVYVHGHTYLVSRSRANDISHLMARANHNERSMGSPNRDLDRRKVIDVRVGKVLIDPRAA